MRPPPPRPPQHPESFSSAETLVARALVRQGWLVLARNFRTVGTELDLVARKGKTLIVVEVKARRFAPETSRALEALLPPAKRRALRRGAEAFLTRLGVQPETVRFDLAVVIRDVNGTETNEAGTGPASVRYYVDVLN